MYCQNCGKKLADNEAVCQQCGCPAKQNAEIEFAGSVSNTMQPAYKERKSLNGLLVNVLQLLIIMIVGAIISNQFLSPQNMGNVFVQFAALAPLAISVLITYTHKGPDLSVAAIACLAGCVFAVMNGSTAGVLLALCLGCAFGALNGLFVSILRLPGLIVTIVSAALIRGIAYLVTEGSPIELMAENNMRTGLAVPAVVVLAIAVGTGLIYLFFSAKTGNGQTKLKPFLAYVISGGLGVACGIFTTLRMNAGIPTALQGMEIFIIFVAAMVYSTPGLKGNPLQALVAVLPVFVWCALNNYFTLIGLNIFLANTLIAVFAALALLVAYFTKTDRKLWIPLTTTAVGTLILVLIPVILAYLAYMMAY